MGQKTSLDAIAGPHGIWVICGDKLPKNFNYIIARQKNGGEWIKVATVKMPASKEQIQADLLYNEKAAGLDIQPLGQERLQAVWDRVSANIINNSPPEMQNDLPLRAATGTAWYDAEADSATTYRYRVQVNGAEGNPENATNIIRFPVKKFITDIKPSLIKPAMGGIYGEFRVLDKGQMTRCKILRSYYLRGGFEEINVTPLFISRGGQLLIGFNDNSAMPKVPYTYVVQPIDAAGNKGFASPELKAFDVAEKSIVPSVHQFRTYSDEKRRAVRLGWKLADTKNITSIDIYKSATFNGTYTKLGSVSATDTSYYDYNVKPITTYYYTVKLNGNYETSTASPRVPGILKASDKNLYPPLNVQLRQDNDKVILSWEKNEPDTRAYFVYRANRRTGELKQLGPPIVTDSARVSFTDVLPVSGAAVTYAYAIADENTSYAISPKSDTLFTSTLSVIALPIPYKLSARKTDHNQVQLFWPDMRSESKTFLGYAVFRSVTAGGKTSVPQRISQQLIRINMNTFTDTTASAPGVYHYTVKTVSMDGRKLGSASPEAGYTLSEETLAAVSNIKLIPLQGAVEISWNNPLGVDIAAIQISRAIEGQSPQVIATLDPGIQAYTDKTVSQGNTYYYTFITKSKNGKLSPGTDFIGVHMR